MKLLIVHDAVGKIVSVGRVQHHSEQRGFGVLPQPGHHTLEVEVSGAISEKPLIDIHNHCIIDVNSKQLMLKSEYFKRKPGSPKHE
jgi:hypothetical protein